MTPPPDHDLNRRIARLRELGLGAQPDEELDAFATRLAQAADAPYAMVNLTNSRGMQYFAGLHVPGPGTGAGDEMPSGGVPREMPREHGYCPDVLEREGRVLVLADVTEWSKFSANEVHDRLNINAYAGAALVDARSNTVLGTVCIVDTASRPKSSRDDLLQLIKDHRDEVMQHIYDRTGGAPR